MSDDTGWVKVDGTRLGRRRGAHGLDLAGVDVDDADARGDELLAQCVGEAADGGLGGAVDASASVRLTAWGFLFVRNLTYCSHMLPREEEDAHRQWSQC